MKNLTINSIKILLLLVTMSSCACINKDTAFGLDGKAVSWCEASRKAEKICKDHGGIESYNPIFLDCKDGTKFQDYK